MTREEAIEIIRNGMNPRRISGLFGLTDAEVKEATEMAISALEQQNGNCVLTMFGKCSYNETGCSDCLIKQKIFKALKQQPCEDAVSREAVINIVKLRWDYYKNCIEAIEKLPPVTVRQDCEYRHENGNCLKVGGFCTAVDDKHCYKCAMNGSGSKYCDNCKYKRQTGEWIYIDDYHTGKFKCSVCQTEGYPNTTMYKPTWNFCPNCGARMSEPRESEDKE